MQKQINQLLDQKNKVVRSNLKLTEKNNQLEIQKNQVEEENIIFQSRINDLEAYKSKIEVENFDFNEKLNSLKIGQYKIKKENNQLNEKLEKSQQKIQQLQNERENYNKQFLEVLQKKDSNFQNLEYVNENLILQNKSLEQLTSSQENIIQELNDFKNEQIKKERAIKEKFQYQKEFYKNIINIQQKTINNLQLQNLEKTDNEFFPKNNQQEIDSEDNKTILKFEALSTNKQIQVPINSIYDLVEAESKEIKVQNISIIENFNSQAQYIINQNKMDQLQHIQEFTPSLLSQNQDYKTFTLSDNGNQIPENKFEFSLNNPMSNQFHNITKQGMNKIKSRKDLSNMGFIEINTENDYNVNTSEESDYDFKEIQTENYSKEFIVSEDQYNNSF